MSVAQKGRTFSEETIEKMCKAQSGREPTTKGTRIWNDGERNYYIPIDQQPEPHLVLGMLRKKHNDNKPGGNSHNKGKVYYNDGIRNYFTSGEPEPHWIRGMMPK